MTWYPHLCEDGMWQPRHKDGRTVSLWFDRPGECMAYLNRSGLSPVRRFTEAWSATARQMILPPSPAETSPAGPEDGPPDDDRFEWVNIATMGDAGPVWTKGACRHKTPVPVDAYPTGELVAWLCPDCGGSFDPDRWPVPEDMWRRIPERVLNSPTTVHKTDGQLQFKVQKVSVADRVWSGFVVLWGRLKSEYTAAILWLVGVWWLIGYAEGWW